MAQVVAEPRVAVTAIAVVRAVEPVEAIGVVVPEPNVAEAMVKAMLLILTLLRRIEEDAAEKNDYIDSSSTPCSKVGLPHLAAGDVRNTSFPSQKHCQSAEPGTSSGHGCIRAH